MCVAGVALGDMNVHFVWQAWYLLPSTCTLRGRRRHSRFWWRAWARLGAFDAAACGVAGVALGHMDVHFAWQARTW